MGFADKYNTHKKEGGGAKSPFQRHWFQLKETSSSWWLFTIVNARSSIGQPFRPHWGGGEKWQPFRFRPPSWMTLFPVPQTRSSEMADGSGRAAIFHLHINGVRKGCPKSLLTSFPAPSYRRHNWVQAGGAGNDVCRTSRLPWRHPLYVCPICHHEKGVVLAQKRPVDVWSYIKWDWETSDC